MFMYVHIKANSMNLAIGDRVKRGEKICESGDVGFCPEPHLHIQMHTSQDKKAETVKFALLNANNEMYFPHVGELYSSLGVHEIQKT